MDTSPVFSDEERDILQEVMNITFGYASADLAEVIDIYVVLSVPYIKLLHSTELPGYILNELKRYETVSIIEQHFHGKFKGVALLIFPSRAGRALISLLDNEHKPSSSPENMALLEKESLVEVANILIGACVGKLAELLKEIVTYSPPRIIVDDSPQNTISRNAFDPSGMAILMKTVFQFDQRDVGGFLFILTNQESIAWLRTALHEFLESYE